mmetsp:Transcript_15876/g.32115  ORF Transcript_15876/g.32115 Transcript_15876/m.32115 type:complete len:267 (-) Transcript_15876:210-1010(-)
MRRRAGLPRRARCSRQRSVGHVIGLGGVCALDFPQAVQEPVCFAERPIRGGRIGELVFGRAYLLEGLVVNNIRGKVPRRMQQLARDAEGADFENCPQGPQRPIEHALVVAGAQPPLPAIQDIPRQNLGKTVVVRGGRHLLGEDGQEANPCAVALRLFREEAPVSDSLQQPRGEAQLEGHQAAQLDEGPHGTRRLALGRVGTVAVVLLLAAGGLVDLREEDLDHDVDPEDEARKDASVPHSIGLVIIIGIALRHPRRQDGRRLLRPL